MEPEVAATGAEGVPIDADTTHEPNPVESTHHNQPEPKRSLDEIIEQAEAKVLKGAKDDDEHQDTDDAGKADKSARAKADKKAKVDDTEAAQATKNQETKRSPDGKFTAKQPEEGQDGETDVDGGQSAAKTSTTFSDPPKRFSEDAKKSWAEAPEPVRAEVHRAVKEMEDGITRYRQAFEPLKPYAELAQQANTTIPKVLDQYLSLEKTLRENPMEGMQRVANYAGINLREFASQILDEMPDEYLVRQDHTIQELRSHIARLEQQVGGVTQSIENQHRTGIKAMMEEFAAKPEHSRFAELESDIAFFLKSDKISAGLSPQEKLAEAYRLAERLNPAPNTQTLGTQPATSSPDAGAHTPKGGKSIKGAPASGSDPAVPAKRKGKKSTIDESLDRAFSRASL